MVSLSVQEKVSIVRQSAKKFPYVDNLDQLKSLTAECGGFLSVTGAAQMLGCNRADIAKFERKGEISGFRLKTTFTADSQIHDDSKDHIFIALDSVKAFVERKKQGVAAPKVVEAIEN